jgi:dipeptidyl aminopeptidase/acylaminoacyl peptidase
MTRDERIDIAAYVEAFFDQTRAGGGFAMTTATDLEFSPDGRRIAFTAVVQVAGQSDPKHHVAVLELGTGAIVHHGPGRAPRWDPSGLLLAWPADDHIAIRHNATDSEHLRLPVTGVPEYVAWRPDGRAVLVGVAEYGAELSDADGSGTVPGAQERQPGQPLVERDQPSPGGRSLWLLDPVSGTAERVSPENATVWQAAWAGPSSIVCVVSPGASESSWYGAQLAVLDPDARALRVLPFGEDGQVALPAANPSGSRLSAVAGVMSDRGVYTGALVLIDPAGGRRTPVDTLDVDVSSQHWDGETTIVFAGLRGLDTVIGRCHIDSGTTEEISILSGTCGPLLPEIAVRTGMVAAVTHRYGVPPALTVLEHGGAARELLSFGHRGTDHLAAVGGALERVAWKSPDGTTIEGLLATPPGPGPHPLVVNIHGGPVWAWRDEWSMHYAHTPLLVGRGYAVLHPNMRGSAGRGPEFIAHGLRDLGGADAADVIAGVEQLIANGQVDPERVAVTGNSYGGYLAAWLVATTDRFAAAIARSPVTDWVSQHYTSNIPGFDRLCFTGDPLDPKSGHRIRSPFYLADLVRTPVLLMAGAHDLATPAEQARMFHRALVEHGADSTLVIYPDEGHGVRGAAALTDQCVRMIEFLRLHLDEKCRICAS